jgi:hypothetical protein
MTIPAMGPLSPGQIDQFITQGFVRLNEAFSPNLAEEARTILWRDLPGDPDNPASWTRPVVRLGIYSQPPFQAAADTPRLRGAFDQLVGPGRWRPCRAMGTFPVRFPSPEDPDDTGWHIDVSFGTEAPDFLDWRANIVSRGRALLMLFLFSDVGEDDAPTRMRVGSHRDVARLMAPAGEAGLSLRQLVDCKFGQKDGGKKDGGREGGRDEITATGAAGTVWLCHPFLVHAAQANRGRLPRFMAQPPLLPADALRLDGPSPVERAIASALAEHG